MNNTVQILRYMDRQIVELDQVSAVEEERVKELRLFAKESV